MTSSFLYVVRAGLQTTVQDSGRWGWQARGVSVAGAMDPYAYRLANALVGNDRNAAALEVAFTGPEIEFADARIIAIAGTDFAVTVDVRSVPMRTAVRVEPGARLTFGERGGFGARAYLAVAGGIAVPEVLGSRSTHVGSHLGGMMGRRLTTGDRVPLGDPAATRKVLLDVSFDPDPVAGDRQSHRIGVRVRVLPDPQITRFTEDALDVLQSAPYTVGPHSDRMGYRLEGPQLQHRGSADILSDVTPLGALQVPASGQPILLMADRQTTGGYTRIATVISADIGIAGQLAPGDRVSFASCSAPEALEACLDRERTLRAIEERRPA